MISKMGRRGTVLGFYAAAIPPHPKSLSHEGRGTFKKDSGSPLPFWERGRG